MWGTSWLAEDGVCGCDKWLVYSEIKFWTTDVNGK